MNARFNLEAMDDVQRSVANAKNNMMDLFGSGKGGYFCKQNPIVQKRVESILNDLEVFGDWFDKYVEAYCAGEIKEFLAKTE